MTSKAKETIREWGKGMWAPFVRQARLPRLRYGSIEQRLTRLEDEAAIIDTFRRYHYYYDAHDANAVASCFTEGGVQINGRGTFTGRDQIRASYDYLISNQRMVIHHGTNAMVRFEPGSEATDAWLTAVFIAVFVPHSGEAAYVGGNYVMRMEKVGTEWLFAEHRITYSYKGPFELVPRVLSPNQPSPDDSLSTRDLIEERYQFA